MNNKKLIVIHRGLKNLPSFDVFGPVPKSISLSLYKFQTVCDVAQKFVDLGYQYAGSLDFAHEHNAHYQDIVNQLIEKGWPVKFLGWEDNSQLFAELRRAY
jgi:hypothetical protein